MQGSKPLVSTGRIFSSVLLLTASFCPPIRILTEMAVRKQLTSKLWNTHHAEDDVEKAVDESLADLQTDYLDLYLVSDLRVKSSNKCASQLLTVENKIHWPVSYRKVNDTERFPVSEETFGIDLVEVPLIETWRGMEALVKKGKVKTIGVSNFSKARLEEIWDAAEIKPAVNQIEIHPYFAQPDFVKYCQDKVNKKQKTKNKNTKLPT